MPQIDWRAEERFWLGWLMRMNGLARDARDGRYIQLPNGKMNGSLPGGGKNGTIKPARMSRKEARRVSSGILTDHPNLRPGSSHTYQYGDYSYRFRVNGPGDYLFYSREKIK